MQQYGGHKEACDQEFRRLLVTSDFSKCDCPRSITVRFDTRCTHSRGVGEIVMGEGWYYIYIKGVPCTKVNPGLATDDRMACSCEGLFLA